MSCAAVGRQFQSPGFRELSTFRNRCGNDPPRVESSTQTREVPAVGALGSGELRVIEWIKTNHQLISVAINGAMLLVWIGYLQVFVRSYVRQTRPKILINRGGGTTLDALCLVSNMSSDAIYVESIIIRLQTDDDDWTCPVTELDGLEEWDEPTDLNLKTRQGTLDPGKVRNMGTFRTIIEHALRASSDDPQLGTDRWEKLKRLDVRIVATYGSEDLPIGANRWFSLSRKERSAVILPRTAGTVQIRSRRERRKIARMLDAEVQD